MILKMRPPPGETPMEPLPPTWCYVFLCAGFVAKLIVVAVIGAAALGTLMYLRETW